MGGDQTKIESAPLLTDAEYESESQLNRKHAIFRELSDLLPNSLQV